MKTDLGKPQYLEYLTYLDCKKRTKKQVGLCDKDKNDEVLVRTILANSSIVEHENERSYSRVYDAVDLICKQLCPGQWCTRSHCQHYSSSSAWNCAKTRPAVCKIYKKYIRNILKNRKLTGKEVVMETNKTKNTDLFLIDPRNIVVVDGFNVRRDFDLDELKEQIKAKGVLNPLTVIAFKDDEGNEKYKLVDGERRYRATMLAISEGADIPYVRAMKARKDASTEELYIQQMMRNEGKKFTEYECAIMFRRFKEEFGYSQVEIADKFKKSPAFISKCLSLLDLPPYIQERIMKGELSVKAAKEIAANYGSEKEQVKAAKSAVDNAKENGRAIATNKEVLNSLKDSKEAKAIAEALRKVWAYLDGEVIVDVDKLAKLLDKTESLSQAMREYKKGGA